MIGGNLLTVESSATKLAERTRAIFTETQDALHRRIDRMFAWVLSFQFVAALLYTLFTTPYTWSGATRHVHPHVWNALVLGGLLAAFPIFLAIRSPGSASTRFVIAVAQTLVSGLLIHLTNGRIETHFHIFGSLAFLAMYRDWRLLLVASAVTAADHFGRGVWYPLSVYGTATGAQWRFLEHAGWVLFEDVFLVVACVSGTKDQWAVAARQAELEISNARIERQSLVLNSVLTGMNDGLVVVDSGGRYLHFNPAAETILGPEPQETTIENVVDRRDPRREDGTPYTFEELPLPRALRGETVEHEEMQLRRIGDGTRIWAEVHAMPLREESGEPLGAVLLLHDVTERRLSLEEARNARDEAERANRAKSEFLSRMSHELRTPMNAILGFSQILMMDELEPDQVESLDQILIAGAHLLGLIDEVLDIARIEAGKLDVHVEPVLVADLVRESLALVAPMADERRITIEFDPETSPAVLADAKRLRQILLNLLSNAIKYNVPDGVVQIRFAPHGDRLRVQVQDTGPGIPVASRSSLFQPFERLEAANTSTPGTGLGLTHSKRLAEAMEGELGLEDSPVGACFFIDLPLVAPDRTSSLLRHAA